jgi:hypothetical protein
MAWAADDIVVLHASLAQYLPPEARSKTCVATFGDFTQDFRIRTAPNPAFREALANWAGANGGFELLFISATLTDLSTMLQVVRHLKRHRALAIAARHDRIEVGRNYLVFNQFVSAELHALLSGGTGLTGLIVHDNLSVPTSLYVFASYGIPVLALDTPPVADIVSEWNLGLTFRSSDEVEETLDRIVDRYDYYREKGRTFVRVNSWESSRAVHREIWKGSCGP